MSTLSDTWLLYAQNLEESLLQASAVPEKDYTFVDLFALTKDFAFAQWKDRNLEITIDCPGTIAPGDNVE
jgi:hypothetical protein